MLETQPIVTFTEDGHKYETITGKPCVSGSKVADLFKPPFDSSYWKTYKAFQLYFGNVVFKQYKKEMGYGKYPYAMKPPVEFFNKLHKLVNPAEFFKAKDAIETEWLDSAQNGTKFHIEQEEAAYKRGYEINLEDGKKYPVILREKQFDNQSIVDNLSDLPLGECYPELILWHEMENVIILGQGDLVFIDEDRNLFGDDWKNCKKMGKREGSKKFYKPYDHLSDTKITKYEIQQSVYAYILECAGFNVKSIHISHITNYDINTRKRIQCRYLRDEVKSMFETINLEYGKKDK